MSRKIFFCDQIYTDGKFQRDKYMIVEEGKITQIASNIEDNEFISLHGIVLPGLINSHSHSFQVLLRGRNEHPKNFTDWVDKALYPLVEGLDPNDIYTASQAAFAQMLRNGITTVAEFHYIHNKPDGSWYEPIDLISEKVLKAAMSVGIRIRFLFCGYDRGTKPAQKRFHRSAKEVLASVEHLTNKYGGKGTIHIGVAPHSLHGASLEMIEKLVKWATDHQEIAHIHIAEQASDVKLAQDLFGSTPIKVLVNNNLLNKYVAVVHAIWVDEDEIKAIALNNSKHIYNPLTNMYLGDGIAPIPLYLKHRVPTAVGCDANITTNILDEIRTVEWLQRVNACEMGIVSRSLRNGLKNAGTALFEMGTINGARALNLPIGSLVEGNFADFIVINPQDLSFRPLADQPDNIISSLEIQKTLTEVYVGGQLKYNKDTGFANLEEKELTERFQQIR